MTAGKLGLLGIVFVTSDGRITGPRTPRQAVYRQICAGFQYGFGDTDTVAGRKDLLQIHHFRQVGGRARVWAADELGEIRRSGRVGRYKTRIRRWAMSFPTCARRQFPRTRHYVAPINSC